MTIKVDDAIKEAGFVLPNSRVDVLVSMAPQPGSQERISKVIPQDVAVLAGQTVERRDNEPVTVSTVTLALSPAQAERLALAQTEGRLTLACANSRTPGSSRPGARRAGLDRAAGQVMAGQGEREEAGG